MSKIIEISRHWRLLWAGGSGVDPSSRTPVGQVEDSRRLRVLVLALVVVGVIAVDVAAETGFSFWSAPLNTVGAIWSYQRRRSRNVAIKFAIAIGMLLALGAFFGQLLGNARNGGDTRLILAELLIQLQVLHSFDMPRRKDLGYSIVIGVILLGVAATLSQTLAFAPVLLVFLAVALPTLVMDYRSRLGVRPDPLIRQGRGLRVGKSSLPSYFGLFSLVLAIGLGIFAVLPRFPGYQLRMFPVSSPVEIRGDFTGRTIINPGYSRAARNGTGEGEDGQGSGGNGSGGLDSTSYYGFNSSINQNRRGQMTPKVLMRVRSQVEGFWRVLAFDRYTGQGWEISRNDQVNTIRRPPWSYQLTIPPLEMRGKTQEVIQTYSVVATMPNLVPAMSIPREIYFPAPAIAVDPEGGLRAPVQLGDGFTYTVVSDVPYRDRTLLGQAGNNYPPGILSHYLQVPPAIAEQVRNHTEKILADYNRNRVGNEIKPLTSNYEKALYLAQYLKQSYQLPDNPDDLPLLGEDEDLVTAFLFKNRGGYPDHFSTTLTIMLRSIGIPARLVAGFAPGEFNPFTGLYIVRNTDAYAMTEVYFPNYGWFTFDPIPGHPLIPPSVEETQTFTVLQKFWKWVAGWLPSPVTGFLNHLFASIFGNLARFIAWLIALFTQGWLGLITGLTVMTGFAFSVWLIYQQWHQLRVKAAMGKLPPMERLYQYMLRWGGEQGFSKHPAQTPLEYAQVVSANSPPETGAMITEICHAYVSWRYGQKPPEMEKLRDRWREFTTQQNTKMKRQ
ncbi:transglutaminase TgpA family protein [Calothrix sp. NIES-3974]|uniref:transglutaminase TgpA family protein n=1 Tax=Calothrix sp. NIES-3974 TaxID=2005462 RepID=UPI000B5E87AB|nr:DUF3488 and DUF4129 domain-containing transglutaminase family protein [Calothrix sp. NIES-3974]BAZ04610.1 transglutaminase domain-containing protein [Calothrix sp. NIES-3974]